MKNNMRSSLLTILFIIFFIFECSKENSQSPFYILKVRIDPSSNRIESEVRIKHPPDCCFYLNKNLKIFHIIANGHIVSFQRDSSKYLPYTVGTATIIKGDIGKELIIRYTGILTEIINGVNMIDSNLVELALYSAWYPMFKDNTLFNFKLNADLPSSYITVTNGKLEKQHEFKGRNRTKWRSIKSGFDIVLLAAPNLKKMAANQMGIKVEIYFDKIPMEYIVSKKDSLTKAMNQLSDYYGPPRIRGSLRFVYSPRGGWGYSRIPLFVVSEEYALNRLKQEFGQARDFHGTVHEMAHFWWLIADTNTPDDWINEGLAEYSAFRLSEKYFGKAFADMLISEYQEHATQSQTEISIAETESSSEDRYVNRYEKMTLILFEARRRFGQEHLDQVLRALHSQFAGTKNATTESFLDEVENQLGSNAKAFFLQALFQKKWRYPKTIK